MQKINMYVAQRSCDTDVGILVVVSNFQNIHPQQVAVLGQRIWRGGAYGLTFFSSSDKSWQFTANHRRSLAK